MSPAFVMCVALSGLGCQNKPVDPTNLPPVLLPAPANSSLGAPSTAATPTPQPYPRYFDQSFPDVERPYDTHLGSFCATLYSFVFGRDPGMPSAREIEAATYGNGFDQ